MFPTDEADQVFPTTFHFKTVPRSLSSGRKRLIASWHENECVTAVKFRI
jgi:hypothetical protein